MRTVDRMKKEIREENRKKKGIFPSHLAHKDLYYIKVCLDTAEIRKEKFQMMLNLMNKYNLDHENLNLIQDKYKIKKENFI
jgi:hypothetical protein